MKCRIEIYGCQMNVHDGEILESILTSAGHTVSESSEDADAIFIVTCAVREHAETRALGRATHLAGSRGGAEGPLMVLCGCVAQEHGATLLQRMPTLGMVVGPDCYHRIPELLQQGQRVALTEQGGEDYEGFTPTRKEFPRAFITVMRGCDNYCTYCIVPYVRGRERSRPVALILDEVGSLVSQGYGEITLLGQNVNSYYSDGARFPELLKLVSDSAGNRCMIRFVTSHPRDLCPELAQVMASRENICSQFHLPVQSGSDRILAEMNRGYTRAEYLEKVAMLRDLMPDIVLSTDMIAGFPGETEKEFADSLSLLEVVRFDYAFLFRYSERTGTAACDLEPSVPVKERLRRLALLQELQAGITLERSRRLKGRKMRVLVTGPARRPGQTACRTRGNRLVILNSCSFSPGDFMDVEITGADGYTHFGRPLP